MDFFTIQEALKMGMSLELSTLSTNPQPLDFTGFVEFFALPFPIFLCYNFSQAYEVSHSISIVLERGFILCQ